jgi:hypothetical protein
MHVQIERTKSQPGGSEEAIFYPGKGYQLRPPETQRAGMNRVASAKFVTTFDDAADLIAKGYDIRMGRPGVWASYIAASGLTIVRRARRLGAKGRRLVKLVVASPRLNLAKGLNKRPPCQALTPSYQVQTAARRVCWLLLITSRTSRASTHRRRLYSVKPAFVSSKYSHCHGVSKLARVRCA